LLLNDVTGIADEADGMTLVAQYSEEPNDCFAAHRRKSKAVAPPDSPQTLLPLGY
jgi:hypothetical protein